MGINAGFSNMSVGRGPPPSAGGMSGPPPMSGMLPPRSAQPMARGPTPNGMPNMRGPARAVANIDQSLLVPPTMISLTSKRFPNFSALAFQTAVPMGAFLKPFCAHTTVPVVGAKSVGPT